MAREKSKVTIYDVARHAGVAISTVSRVLNDSPEVSDRTKAVVERAIAELKYTPDRTARTLAQQQLHSIAVALPSFTAPFHNELLKGVRAALKDSDLDLLLCDLGSQKIEHSLRTFLGRGSVDGMLICGVPVGDTLATELLATQAPIVLIGEVHPSFTGYHWDDIAGARTAVAHLIDEGHRRIAIIRAEESRIQENRVAGYRLAHEDAGLPVDESLIVRGDHRKHGGFSEEDGADAMRKILEHHPDVTAVFASSDVQAIGAWATMAEIGREVPDEMAIVGYDDIKTSRYLGLSSVDQSMQPIAREATEHLLERIFGADLEEPRITTIEPRLRIRRSSRKPQK